MNLMRIPQRCFFSIMLLCLTSSHAAGISVIEKKITESLNNRFPELEITSIRNSGFNGLYEVMLGSEVVYVTADGRYLFQGNLLDLEQRLNLTEERRKGVRMGMLGKLSDADLIVFSPAEPRHSIYVFTDIDCPYCRRLHQDVPRLNAMGIAVKYLAFPRDGIGSDTFREMEAVWCSKDRNKALTDAKRGIKIKSAKCDDPVGRQFLLGRDMGIRGTPAIYLEDGSEIGGYMSPDEIAEIFKGS